MAKRQSLWWKILLGIVGGLLILWVGGTFYANHLVAVLVKKELAKPRENGPEMKIGFSDISVNLWTGSAVLDTFMVTSDSASLAQERGYALKIDQAKVKYANVLRMLSRKQLYINTVELNGLDAEVFLTDKKEKEFSDTLGLKVYQSILKVIALLDVEHVDINNASFRLRNPHSDFEIKFDSTYLYARNLRYDLRDSTFTYNDSVYELDTRHFLFTGPDGEYTFKANQLYTKNAEGAQIHDFDLICNVPKTQLAVKRGKVPVVWPRISIREINTTPFNLIRSIIEGQFDLDTLSMKVNYVELYRDDTYPPVRVQRPLQTLLMQLETPLSVNRIQLDLDKFVFANKKALGEAGVFTMKNAKLSIENFQNKPSHVIKTRLIADMAPKGGKFALNLAMHLDSLCHWNANVAMKKCDMSTFNPFIGPLMGIDLSGKINQMDARYAGDSLTAKGVITFCYEDLRATILPTSPVPLLAKHHKTITKMAKSLIPAANPRKEGKQPHSYYLSAERNLYKPYILHFIQPMIVGIKQTVLGRFYLAKEVQTWKKKKNNWYEEYKPY